MHHDVAVRRGIGFVEVSFDSSIGAKRGGFQKLVCCLAAHEQDKGRQNASNEISGVSWPTRARRSKYSLASRRGSRCWLVLLFFSKYSDIVGGLMYAYDQQPVFSMQTTKESTHPRQSVATTTVVCLTC